MNEKNPVAEAIQELAGALHRLGMGNADSQGRGAIEAHTMMVTEALTAAADTIADGLREGAAIIAEAIVESRTTKAEAAVLDEDLPF